MGIAMFHPTHQERQLMDDLNKCLQKKWHFKMITERMIVPPITIDQLVDRSNYSAWALAMGLVFFFFAFLGTAIECWQRFILNKNRRQRSERRRSCVRRQGRMENRNAKAFMILGIQDQFQEGPLPEKLPKIS